MKKEDKIVPNDPLNKLSIDFSLILKPLMGMKK
jgi:hypothetical protein